MATYYVWSGATGTNAGTSWTNAYTAFGSAVTAATAAGDVILVHYTHQETVSAATTYTIGNHIAVIAVNKDSNDAPTAMGTGGWIGHTSTSYSVNFSVSYRLFIYGLTIRAAGGSGAQITFASAGTNTHIELESCYLWQGSTNSASQIRLGRSDAETAYVRCVNTTFRFSNSGQFISPRNARLELEGCTIATAGSAPNRLFEEAESTAWADSPQSDAHIVGCDLSHVTNTLVGDFDTSGPKIFRFSQCKLGANVTVLATQTAGNKAGSAAYVFDCSSGDTHGLFGYYDAFGSCVSDTGIYYTTGAAAQSWKIVTTANCSYYTPFVGPFVDMYNTGTSSITPYFEILRDGSTTAYQDDEVWAEFFVKKTSGSTQSTEYSDRMALLGTPANQAAGAGTGSWTGEGANAWSGKVDSGSAVTPAEAGHIRGRVAVGEPSITVYVDPQIRTA